MFPRILQSARLPRLFYSTRPPLQPRDWHTAGHPAPRSLLDDTDDAEPVDLSEDNHAVNRGRPSTPPIHQRTQPPQRTPAEYALHRARIKNAFPNGWNPPHKLSREAMDGLRHLHRLDPETFSTPVLAERFKISPEAVRRILKSTWAPSREQQARFALRERMQRQELILKRRLEERNRAAQLERERRVFSDHEEEDLAGTRVGHVKGINPRDRFTFE
jgi:Neugrin